MANYKAIQKTFRLTDREFKRLAWLVKESGINSESAWIRFIINQSYKEEQGFLKYLEERISQKRKKD